LIIILGGSLTALVVYPGAKTTANPCAVATCGSISILPGSSNPNQLITFSPKVAVVILGLNNTVQWKNTDTVSHTVTSKATAGGLGGLNSAAFGSQETYTYTFTQAGTYFYYCSIHPTMHGEVIVKTHG
jgi:plastocyanin